MKKHFIRIQILEEGTEEVMSEKDYSLNDYPEGLTDWVEGELEEHWEERLMPETEYGG